MTEEADAKNEAEQKPEAATAETAAAPETTETQAEHMIPKSRFDQVNQELKSLRKEAEAAAKAREEAERAAAEEKGEYKKLYETAAAERERLQAEIKALELARLRREIAQRIGLPAGLEDRLAGESEAEITADAETFLSLLPKSSAAAPSTDGGAGRPGQNSTGPSEAEIREMAARLQVSPKYLAESYGVKL